MLRLPKLVGTLTFVVFTGGSFATAKASPPTPIGLLGQVACPDPSEPGQPAAPGARANDELMGSETFQRAMTDVLRLEIAVRFCELRPDTLTLDLGEGASTSASTEYNLSRLYAAYRALTEYTPETAIELRHQDRVAGWYTIAGLSWTEKPAPPPPEPTGEGEGDDEMARHGFHFNAGVGAGAFDQQCRDDCEADAETGISGFLSLGGFLDPMTVLGVEGTGWTKEVSGVNAQVYSAMGQVTRYLSATSGLFLRGGVGLVGYHDDEDQSATGPGFMGRLGYEFLSGKVHIVPYLGYVRTFDGIEMKRNGDEIGFNFVISQFQLGLGVSVY